jgi:hypothetical protein
LVQIREAIAPRVDPPENDEDLETSHQPFIQTKPLHLPIYEVTGWDRSSSLLLIDCIVATLWATALLIFAVGVVPITWGISQWGQAHLPIVEFVVTVVATLTTTHTKRLIQSIVSALAEIRLVTGFTLRQVTWMQGVLEWDLFARFPGY